MSFASLHGQSAVSKLFQQSLQRGRLAHAYLFVGDRGSGKEAMARELAKAVNCLRNKDDACDQCVSCRKIEAGNHPDVQWIRPESKSRRITMAQIREAIRTIYLKPNEGRIKVMVLADAECLQHEAANAFLKTLEEPAANSMLLLLASSPEQLLDTIVSRCLRIQFAGSGIEKLTPEQEKVADCLAEVVAHRDGGIIAQVYGLLGRIMEILKVLRQAKESEVSARMQIEKFADAEPAYRERLEDEVTAAIEAEYRQGRADLLKAFSVLFRDMTVLATGGNAGLLIMPSRETQLRKAASGVTLDWLTDRIEMVEEIQANLRQNVNETLTLEVGLLKLLA